MFPQRSPPCPLTMLVNALGEDPVFRPHGQTMSSLQSPTGELWAALQIHSLDSVVLGRESKSTWLPNIIKWALKLVVFKIMSRFFYIYIIIIISVGTVTFLSSSGQYGSASSMCAEWLMQEHASISRNFNKNAVNHLRKKSQKLAPVFQRHSSLSPLSSAP